VGPVYARLEWADQKLKRVHLALPKDLSKHQISHTNHPTPSETLIWQWLRESLSNPTSAPSFKQLDMTQCTPFQKQVYSGLQKIHCGQTTSYKELANQIGHPNAARAVGTALGNNPFPILIPCHRVIRSDGALGGFSQGLPIKKHLLETEK